MWTWIKQAASAAWSAGKAWIGKSENQAKAVEEGKRLIDGWGLKK